MNFNNPKMEKFWGSQPLEIKIVDNKSPKTPTKKLQQKKVSEMNKKDLMDPTINMKRAACSYEDSSPNKKKP